MTAIMAPTIVWFRLDLRLEDNPALHEAVARGSPVIPVFIWSSEEEAPWAPGAASRWWLHQSLRRLGESLVERGSRLILRRGETLGALRELIRETSAGAVYWNRRYEPQIIARDRCVEEELGKCGVSVKSFNSALLIEPWEIATKAGTPYKVFTPFSKACLAKLTGLETLAVDGLAPDPHAGATGPLGRASPFPQPRAWPRSEHLEDLHLEPMIDWASGIREFWSPGERGAHEVLSRLLAETLPAYPRDRDRPDLDGTSRLSPHLHFGEISPRAVWQAVAERGGADSRRGVAKAGEAYLRQLIWREFAHHLLYHFPHTTDRPLRPEFERMPWNDDTSLLAAWQKGETGYPIVDAGMRQLWNTGWMHNRVRMIVASFLVKDLRISWQDGSRWFWDTLVDADLANNTLGWQWTAGCGADAAPYFRVFNPITQGERYDPAGDYVRRWVLQLKEVPGRFIHQPWKALASAKFAAGVFPGGYPHPVVDHAYARMAALMAYGVIKRRG